MARKTAEPTLHAGEALLKEVFLTLTVGRRPLKIWVFVGNITNQFILGLEIVRTYDASWT
jgi:hypothetical protein